MTKFTPAPWFCEPAHRKGFVIWANDITIIDSHDENGRFGALKNEANANLIATSPELYTELNSAVQIIEMFLQESSDSNLVTLIDSKIIQMKNVLAKARGEI